MAVNAGDRVNVVLTGATFDPVATAVSVAALLPVMVPALALNFTEPAPAITVSEAGATRRVLELDTETEAPAAGAALVNVMVQAVREPGARLVGLQFRADTAGAPNTTTVAARELPL
jgi:hypothetical protein